MSRTIDLPGPVAYIAGLMETYPRPWALCGGWAVDLWLGRTSREHGDLDITIFDVDQPVAFDHFAGWSLIGDDANGDAARRDPWDGGRLDLPAHIHAEDAGGFNLELIVNPGTGAEWVVSTDPPLSAAFDDVVQRHTAGLPVAVPELLMFYKSRICPGCPGCSAPARLRRRDEADFRALMPVLTSRARAWLRHAMDAAQPGHPWRELLD